MPTARTERPRLIGDGPPTCSTCTALAVQPQVIWDTNRYYADLGVDSRVSRADIRRAYQAGPQTERRTFVVKQLLNPVVRRAYDLTPLGSVFLDRYVLDSVNRAAALRASGGARRRDTLNDTPEQMVLDTDRGTEHCSPCSTDWPYAFYLWGTDRQDKKMLSELQVQLVSILGRRKEHRQVAVGLRGGMAPPVEATVVGRRIVVFLHEDEDLTDALVQRAASSLTQLAHTTHTPSQNRDT